MTFEERVKLETKAALRALLEAKEKVEDDEDGGGDGDGDEDGDKGGKDGEEEEEEQEDEELTESLLLGTIAVGATIAGIGKLVDNLKKRSRETQIEKQLNKVLPNLSKDILKLRQRAKLLNSAQDIDSFETATTKIVNDVKSAITTVGKIELNEKELNSLSWRIQSPEKRLEKFRKEIKSVLTNTISDLEDLETVAMQELNAKLGL